MFLNKINVSPANKKSNNNKILHSLIALLHYFTIIQTLQFRHIEIYEMEGIS